jgi:hypothetical protein
LLDPSGETRLHVALEPFVSFDVPGGFEAIATSFRMTIANLSPIN